MAGFITDRVFCMGRPKGSENAIPGRNLWTEEELDILRLGSLFRPLSYYAGIPMKLFFTSDLHWGHSKILEYEPNRLVLGDDVKQHDTALIKRINERVSSDDILIILGDVGLTDEGYLKSCRERINAKQVIIVRGNHDRKSDLQYMKMGFTFICYELVLKIAKEYVRLRHHPYQKPWWKTIFPWQYKERDRRKRPVDRGGFLLHGHSHSRQATRVIGRRINVGIDMNNYYPLSMKDIEKTIYQIKEKEKKKRKESMFCFVWDWIKNLR